MTTMAITASFSPGARVLSVFGDSLDNTIVASRDAAGNILINGGAVSVVGGSPTVASTDTIQVFGQGGDDTISLNEANGALPAAQLFGGAGNDVLTGGSGADLLFGQTGNDTLLGKGGTDLLFGGEGNDVLTGGDGDDQMFGEAGNDRMIWNPGDDSDLMEGGDGIDTAEVNGGNGAETFTITPNGTRVRFDRTTPGPFFLDIGTTENLVLNMNGGDDTFIAGNGLATLIQLTVDGGAGNDTIIGGDGNDMLIGGDGNDLITGGRGNDFAQLGTGDDTFVWNPGDGSDVVDGQAGTDTLQFNGANIAEKINITANQGRVQFTRDVASINMDLNGIEHINFVALGGADTVTVGDLTGTGVTQVAIDLAGVPGSGVGDGAADSVTVNGTAGNDTIIVTGEGTSVTVTGLPEQVNIDGTEAASDVLTIKGGDGNDTISAASLPANIIGLTIDGGAGNDFITGSQGNDALFGGDGNDLVVGGRGNDTASLGNGDDTFVWFPGDGSDVVEGQAGTDTLIFVGANIAENIDISANGTRARLTRDIGSVTMDLDGVEHIQLAALGGADNITINDLTGTAVNQVFIDLSAMPGSGQGDGAVDHVTVAGTTGSDSITIAGANGNVAVAGLPALVGILHADATDVLTFNAGDGNDVINASGLAAGTIGLILNGGAGNDLIVGSQGNDLVNGGTGNDMAFLGAGNDTFVWNPGDGSDTVDGQAGIDTLLFNGANIAEKIDISANGTRVRLSRDIGTVVMDVNGTETLDVHTLGGADTVTVNDLTGTNVTQVKIDLGANGVGDGEIDTIVINATNGDDAIRINNNNGVVTVSMVDQAGVTREVTITDFDATDKIVINGLGGNDVINASGLTGMQLTANGGDGDDILIGSAGNDTLTGGPGNDILIGNGGQDILDGGPGGNVIFQAPTNLAVLGQFMASSFVTASNGLGAMPVVDQSSQPPLLTPPHA
jgi:Ca2+-binding RTX toxin-like protein